MMIRIHYYVGVASLVLCMGFGLNAAQNLMPIEVLRGVAAAGDAETQAQKEGLARLRYHLGELTGKLEATQERERHLKNDIEELRLLSSKERQEHVDLVHQVMREKEEPIREVLRLQVQLKQVQEERYRAEQALAALQQTLAQRQQELKTSSEQAEALRVQLARVSGLSEAERKGHGQALQEAQKRSGELAGQIRMLNERIEQLQKELATAQGQLRGAQEETGRVRGERDAAQGLAAQRQQNLTAEQNAHQATQRDLTAERSSWKKYLVGAAGGAAAAGLAAAAYFLCKGRPSSQLILLKPQRSGPGLFSMVASAISQVAGCGDIKVPALVKPKAFGSGLSSMVESAIRVTAGCDLAVSAAGVKSETLGAKLSGVLKNAANAVTGWASKLSGFFGKVNYPAGSWM